MAGEDNTFLKHAVSARMVVDNKNVDIAALVIMPKYKMDLAKSHKALMQQRLDLALSCVVENGEAAFREALGNSGVWSFSMHKKLMYRFTALYVLETGEVVDEHPHFVQSSCSEHAFFYKGVLGQLDLNPIARGPKSKNARQPRRAKRTDEFRKKMRTPPRQPPPRELS